MLIVILEFVPVIFCSHFSFIFIFTILMGSSVHAPIKRNSTYIQTVRWSIYNTRWPKHPHSPIHLYIRRPQGPNPLAPLHGILTNTAHSRSISMSQFTFPCGVKIYSNSDNSTAASTARPLPRQLSALGPVIGIGHFVWLSGYDLIWLTGPNLIQLTGTELIQLDGTDVIQTTVSDLIRLMNSTLIRLILSDWIWLTVSDWIWLSFFILLN